MCEDVLGLMERFTFRVLACSLREQFLFNPHTFPDCGSEELG